MFVAKIAGLPEGAFILRKDRGPFSDIDLETKTIIVVERDYVVAQWFETEHNLMRTAYFSTEDDSATFRYEGEALEDENL